MRFKTDENLPEDVLRRLMPMLVQEPLAKHLWIVEDDRVRIWDRGLA